MNFRQMTISFFLLSLFISCGSSQKDLLSPESKETIYRYEDKGGQYFLKRDHRYLPQKKYFVTKSELLELEQTIEQKEESKPLETTAVISIPGSMNGVSLLRPHLSQHHVWFDGKRYSSEILFNVESKRLDVKLRSPEEKWNGNKTYLLPKGTGAFCFYTQLVECVAYTGFFEKAVSSEAGEMNLHIIWDGFPYMMEQFVGIPYAPFSPASIQYDGILDKDFFRFIVEHNDQTFFLIFDKNLQFVKQLWVAQGLSISKE